MTVDQLREAREEALGDLRVQDALKRLNRKHEWFNGNLSTGLPDHCLNCGTRRMREEDRPVAVAFPPGMEVMYWAPGTFVGHVDGVAEEPPCL